MESNFNFGRWLSSPPPGEEVVISGMSGRFPESNNIFEYRDNLLTKKNMITDDDRRWKLDNPEIPQRTGKIYNIDKTDAGFFGLHYRQADMMNPMMRTLLETAIEAIMDAGINISEMSGSKTGVFVGICWDDVERETLYGVTEAQKFALTGVLRCFLSHRISYYLKLRGPSYTVDTACSSSLSAVDHAFKAIRTGQCDNALIGTCNLLLHPEFTRQFARLGFLSPDGMSRVFDRDADGYVRSETVACIFLQKAKLSRRIYAKILGTKLNSDGFKDDGITFPSAQSQVQIMADIYSECEICPSQLSYLEAHGTGTKAGDTQEIKAIDEALAKNRAKPLLIGSVKSNIGHTEACSGLCSIIKVLIAMETGQIAPNINFKNAGRRMKGLKEGRMMVVTEVENLEGHDAVVGINNFGFGGSNAHIVLQRFQKINNYYPEDDIPRLICVSGRTEEAVLSLLDDVSSKSLDSDYIGLIREIFKTNIDGHLYRGYTILSKCSPRKTSCHLAISGTCSPYLLYFGPFENQFGTVGQYLLDFTIFKSTLQCINDMMLPKHVDLFKIISAANVQSEDNHIASFAVQIGIAEIFKRLNLRVKAVYEGDLAKLVTDYYYDVVTLKEVVLAALEIIGIKPKITPKIDNVSSKNTGRLVNFKTVNISDSRLNSQDFMVVENNSVQLLDILGSLYEQGFNLEINKLYPEVKYPVKRNTSMLSPLIKWNHKKSWHTPRFDNFTGSSFSQREFYIDLLNQEHKFIEGHVIDGRNLFPATEYLYLVWQTLVQSSGLEKVTDFPIVFQNCKFIRTVTLTKNNAITLLVNIQRGTGHFEILQNDFTVVTGQVYPLSNTCQDESISAIKTLDDQNPREILEQEEIYQELYIRGYSYRDLFKGLVKCNVEASVGLIKWENNWTTFMDQMLQIKILQTGTSLLYVPVGIERLSINPAKHLEILNKQKEPLLQVYACQESNVIISGGIEIQALQVTSIRKRKQRLEPVLEKYVFVPNESCFDKEKGLSVNIQIIHENWLGNYFKAVEIPDDFETEDKLLLPYVSKILDGIPLVKPDLTIMSAKNKYDDIPGIKMENSVLTPNSNLTLIIAANIFQKPTLLEKASSALSSNGFILTREDVTATFQNVDQFVLFTEYTTEKEKLFLFQKRLPISETKLIEISSSHLDWLTELQNAIKVESDITIYAYNKEPNGILGLFNSLRREPSGRKIRCFFMMDPAPKFTQQHPFYEEQVQKNMAVNVYKNSRWGTCRHLPLENPKEVETEHCYVNVMTRGDLSTLKWLQGPLSSKTPLENDKPLVYIYYSALNFRDVMIASGRINPDMISKDLLKQDCMLGIEFSGRDASGRRVAGMIDSKSLATLAVADSGFLWEVPENWSLEDAATVPVVYITVIYGLLMVAKLKRGSSVLIHSATGGIGLATLNVCRHFDCNIFVTVGTQEKRDYLKKHFPEIPDCHVGNSRDISFEKMVKTGTKGQGVNIVLNSLSDEKLLASVRCLSRKGCFLEIGKADLASNKSINVLFLENEISYHGVMIDQIQQDASEIKQQIHQLVSDGIKDGWVKPLPRVVFDTEHVETAYRFMSSGHHIGKILIKVRNEEQNNIVKLDLPKGIPRFNCDFDKSYVIIGGLGGVGLELANWLVLRGAKKLVLTSRKGVQTGYQAHRIRIWESCGILVHISTSDVTTKQGCHQLIDEANNLGSIGAVFNLAVVLQDALFENQTKEKFLTSFKPKAEATIILDKVTRKLCPNLRYFVVFSSMSCGRGNNGQTNYAMANSIMERICEKRKDDGFSGLAIQWGAIGDVGLIAKMQHENIVVAGTVRQKISSCLEVLDKLLMQDNTVVSSMLVAEKYEKGQRGMNAVETVAYILGIKDIETVRKDATLRELGMDSIAVTEIIQMLENEFGVYLTSQEVRSMTFARLAEIEENKNGADVISTNEGKHPANFLLQFIPDSKKGYASIITKLDSQITDDKEGAVVFVLPGIEGVFQSMESFIRKLKAHVYGVQYNFNNPEDSINEMARNILPHIEKHISRNNIFHVIGYSFGVMVGLEVISLFQNKGYSGQFIAIDGSPTYLGLYAKSSVSAENEAQLQTTLLYGILAKLLPNNVLTNNKQNFLNCKDFNERMGLALTLVNATEEQQLEIKAAFPLYKRYKAILNYEFVHEKIKCEVHLVKAKFPMTGSVKDDYDLSELCGGPITIKILNGDHFTILSLTELADHVNKLIQ